MKNQLVVKSCVLCECFLSLTQSMIAHSHFFITDLCITLTNPWLIVNDCPNHKPMVDLWLPPNQPPTITAAAQGEQTVAAHGEQRPHGYSRDLNPTHSKPRPPPAHGNLNPMPIWSLQANLEREEKLSLWEEERRERGRKRGEEKKEESRRKRECD